MVGETTTIDPAPGVTAQDGVEPVAALLICDQTGGRMVSRWPVPQHNRDVAAAVYSGSGGYRTVPLYTTPTPTIPAGMVAWNGGDSAPDDFAYGPVQFSDQSIGSVSKASDLWSRAPVSGEPHVIAYTPLAAAPKQAEQGVDVEWLQTNVKTLTFALLTISQEDDGPIGRYAAKIVEAQDRLAALNATTGEVEKGEATPC